LPVAISERGAAVKGGLINHWSAQGFGEERDKLVILLNIRPPELEVPQTRPPVCLGIAIDRSSSMVGTRMSLAIEAVRQICSRLGERDSLCVVAFDASTKIVRPPGAVGNETAMRVSGSLVSCASVLVEAGLFLGLLVADGVPPPAWKVSTRRPAGGKLTGVLEARMIRHRRGGSS
jgi:hypothetical protein